MHGISGKFLVSANVQENENSVEIFERIKSIDEDLTISVLSVNFAFSIKMYRCTQMFKVKSSMRKRGI